MVPGDPAQIIAGQAATEETVQQIRRQLGLHLPLHIQYLNWVTDVVQGDLGRSIITGKPVFELLADRYPRSLELTILGMAFSVIIAFPAGITSAIKRNTKADYVAMFFSQVGVSLPSFWLGILFILVFAKYLNVLPPSGYTPFLKDPIANLQHAFLPALSIGIINGAVITRFLRSSMLEKFGEDYIRTARSAGHPEKRVIGKYALKNALIPTLTIIGLQFGWLMGGVVIIEQVFAWPGVGRLVLDGIETRNYPVVQASLLALAGTFVLINLVVDLLYAWVDPRIKY
jgi:peptide/nickel transport system permease protein